MNPFKRLAGQTAIYGLPAIIGRFFNYLLVPLYTYNFLPGEYGVVTEMYAYVSFLIIVLTYGMETALFNFSVKHADKDRVYSTILLSVAATSALFILALNIFAQPVAELIQHSAHPEYVIWFAWILGLDAVSSIAFAKLREQQKAKTFALIKTLNIAVNIIFNIFFIVVCQNDYEKMIIDSDDEIGIGVFWAELGIGSVFVSNLLASIVTLLALSPAFFRIKFLFDRELIKQILPYALPLLAAGLAGMTNETIDRILLKYLLPENIALEQVGIYGACYKISIIMMLFIQTFRYAAEPFFFSRSAESDAKMLYARVMNYFVIVCLVIFLGTLMNLSWLKYFIAEEYWGGLNVVPVLLMANFCLGVFFNLSVWYKLTGRTQWGAYLAMFGSLITLAGNFIFIPKFGYMASAWTTLACYASMMVLCYFIGNKQYPVNYDLQRFFGYLVLSLTLFFISEKIILSSEAMNLVAKNILLAGFVVVVGMLERKNFRMKNENPNHQ